MNVSAEQSVARRVREKVLQSHNRFWRIEDLGESTPALHQELHRLVAEGEIERVRRGVYWRGRPTRWGRAVPRTAEGAREVVGDEEAVGAAEWYATNLLGLSTQVSPVEVLAVTGRPPQGFNRDVRFVSRQARVGRRDKKLTDLEITLLEVLDGFDHYVELPPQAAMARLSTLLSDKRIRPRRLAAASPTEPARVRERLRYLLNSAGFEEEAHRVPRARSASTRRNALAGLGAT